MEGGRFMPDYKKEVRNYLLQFDSETIALGVQAVKRCLLEGKTWEWIITALKKKSPNNWSMWGFGLLFNENFNFSVLEQMDRNHAAKEANGIKELRDLFYDCEEPDEESGNEFHF